MPGSCDRAPRKLVTANPEFVFRLLSQVENTSFVRQGLTTATSDSATGNGLHSGGTASRRPAPPLRTTGCLKKLESNQTARCQSLVFEISCPNSRLAQVLIGESSSPDPSRAANRSSFAVRLEQRLPPWAAQNFREAQGLIELLNRTKRDDERRRILGRLPEIRIVQTDEEQVREFNVRQAQYCPRWTFSGQQNDWLIEVLRQPSRNVRQRIVRDGEFIRLESLMGHSA
jgi:hypothetical protein